MTVNILGPKLGFALAALISLLWAWPPRVLSQRIGEVSPGARQSRPLVLACAAFVFAALILPVDAQLRSRGIDASVCATLVGWITYRANPDSWPIVGSRSRPARAGILVLVALLGAIVGAAFFVIFAEANPRGMPMPRFSEAAHIGATFGPGVALAIWERRANSKLLAQRGASAG